MIKHDWIDVITSAGYPYDQTCRKCKLWRRKIDVRNGHPYKYTIPSISKRWFFIGEEPQCKHAIAEYVNGRKEK
jgi:hypothetical protein